MSKQIDSEKDIERKLVRLTKANGGMCIKLLCDQLTGLPDRMCLFPNGSISFAELKTTGKKPSKIQKCVHARIRSLGFMVEVIDTLGGVEQFIEKATNGNKGN